MTDGVPGYRVGAKVVIIYKELKEKHVVLPPNRSDGIAVRRGVVHEVDISCL